MGDPIDERNAEAPAHAGGKGGGRQGTAGDGQYVPYLDEPAGRAVPADSPWSHASFFSGVGGVDLGLERAGWRTVSFSEIEKYPSRVLAERWPGVPNLGDITGLVGDERGRDDRRVGVSPGADSDRRDTDIERVQHTTGWQDALLWTGGFPCQDLSIAGRRKGLAGERSGLAFAFFDLLDRYRDVPERWIILENVQGLLSSHGGRDMASLLGTLGDLGFGWSYRCLDGRHFDVPQRRVRVFIVGHSVGGHPDLRGPGEVLAVGTRCRRHPPTGIETGEGTAARARGGVARSLRAQSQASHREDSDNYVVGHGVAADGATTTRTIPAAAGHHGYAIGAQDADGGLLQVGDGNGNTNAVTAKWSHSGGPAGDEHHHLVYGGEAADPTGDGAPDGVASGSYDLEDLLPTGIDGHRLRACGNGVIAGKAEWLGTRLREYIEVSKPLKTAPRSAPPVTDSQRVQQQGQTPRTQRSRDVEEPV